MREIISTDGYTIIVDEETYRQVSSMRWCTYGNGGTRYALRSHHGPTISMHRMITNCPKDKQVDHINHNGLDNRLANLRICTKAENLRNRDVRADNVLGISGVGKYNDNCSRLRRRGKWYARIQANGKRISLGEFKSLDLAIQARKRAELLYFGEFAYSKAS